MRAVFVFLGLAIATVNSSACRGGAATCPGNITCCKAGTNFLCCPFVPGVCCSDSLRCCPAGYQCTRGQGCAGSPNGYLKFMYETAPMVAYEGDFKDEGF